LRCSRCASADPGNYADAKNLVDKLKDTLTDPAPSRWRRTNTLIVKDVQEALLRAEGSSATSTRQTPEVLIESRIVEAATSFSRQVGIQWGGNVSFAPTTGTRPPESSQTSSRPPARRTTRAPRSAA